MASTAPEFIRELVTWDDFIALDDGDRRELIDGELIEVEVPTDLHEHIVLLLGYFLHSWVRPRKAGRLLGSGYKLKISEYRGVMPDVQFYAADNPVHRAFPPQGMTAGRPDLVVEIISPSSRRCDRTTKLEGYALLRVPEYWIIDPEKQRFERLTLTEAGQYVVTHDLVGDAVFAPPSFEGLEIPLGELWAPAL